MSNTTSTGFLLGGLVGFFSVYGLLAIDFWKKIADSFGLSYGVGACLATPFIGAGIGTTLGYLYDRSRGFYYSGDIVRDSETGRPLQSSQDKAIRQRQSAQQIQSAPAEPQIFYDDKGASQPFQSQPAHDDNGAQLATLKHRYGTDEPNMSYHIDSADQTIEDKVKEWRESRMKEHERIFLFNGFNPLVSEKGTEEARRRFLERMARIDASAESFVREKFRKEYARGLPQRAGTSSTPSHSEPETRHPEERKKPQTYLGSQLTQEINGFSARLKQLENESKELRSAKARFGEISDVYARAHTSECEEMLKEMKRISNRNVVNVILNFYNSHAYKNALNINLGNGIHDNFVANVHDSMLYKGSFKAVKDGKVVVDENGLPVNDESTNLMWKEFAGLVEIQSLEEFEKSFSEIPKGDLVTMPVKPEYARAPIIVKKVPHEDAEKVELPLYAQAPHITRMACGSLLGYNNWVDGIENFNRTGAEISNKKRDLEAELRAIKKGLVEI